jgi:hypothetical protein
MKIKAISGPFTTQVASDVIRDGLGVELLAGRLDVFEDGSPLPISGE